MAINFNPIDPLALEGVIAGLLGAGVTLVGGSVNYTGAAGQGALFSDGLAAVGMANGLLLSSGSAFIQPSNTEPGWSQTNGLSGDSDLNAAIQTVQSGVETNDANILTFRVTAAPGVTSLTFTFAFGSEEYPEFVDEFADIAVIMINGVNYAFFPNETPLTVIADNLSAFRNNTLHTQSPGGLPLGPQVVVPIEYDGISQLLSVTVPLQAGENLIKLAIGDTGDFALDSGLFIGAIFGGASAPGPIQVGATTYSLAPPAVSHNEGNSGSTQYVFTVNRTGDVGAGASFNYSVAGAGSTPANGADFAGGVLPTGLVTFTAGQTSAQVTVNVAGDTAQEPDEAFRLTVNSPSGELISGLNFIFNDDSPSSLWLLTPSLTQVEGASGVVSYAYTVMRSGDASAAADINYTVLGSGQAPTNAADFASPLSGQLSFAAGQAQATLTIQVAGDGLMEGQETFTVAFSGSGFNTVTAAGTIVNDDVRPPAAPGGGGGASAPAMAEPSLGEQLTLAYQSVLRQAATGREAAFLDSLIGRVEAGQTRLAEAIDAIVHRADATTSVATLSYGFLLGATPSEAGLDYLVSRNGGNPTSFSSDYYAGFNLENRYINATVSLAVHGEARSSFVARYGRGDLFDATKSAYAEIFGFSAGDQKVHDILDTVVAPGMTRADYFAALGGGALGAKAAMAGWLLAEAVKADVGVYAEANEAYLTDLADGGAYRVDLVGVYSHLEHALNI